MFYLFVSSFNIKGHVCTQELAVNQTSWGGLSVKHKGYQKARFRTWCVVRKTYQRLAAVWKKIDTSIHTILSTSQNLLQSTMNLAKNAQNINLSSGSVTCHENTIENANCPKDQYMEVKSA